MCYSESVHGGAASDTGNFAAGLAEVAEGSMQDIPDSAGGREE